MKRVTSFFKRNLYFMVSVFAVFLAIVFSIVIMSIFDLSKDVEKTSVGFIYLGNFEPDQYETILSQRIQQWKNTADYKIIYQNNEYIIDITWFDFEIDETINQISVNQNNRAFFSLSTTNDSALKTELENTFTTSIVNQFAYQWFIDDLLEDMGSLKNRKVYQLIDYLDETASLHVISEKIVSSVDSEDVISILENVTEIKIFENSRFSLLNYLKHTTLSNTQLSVIASAMQELMIETHFNGFIFEQNPTMPDWAEIGSNVRILKVNQFDFSFFNGLNHSYTIMLEKLTDTSIEFKLIGYPYITEYKATQNIEVIIPYQTIIIENEEIDDATPEVIVTETDTHFIYQVITQTGVDGFVVFFYRTIDPNQPNPLTLTLYNEQYLPIHEIIEQNIVEKVGG